MNDPIYQALWHDANAAAAEIVIAWQSPKDERRERLAEALRCSRAATAGILAVLAEREEEGASVKFSARGDRRPREAPHPLPEN